MRDVVREAAALAKQTSDAEAGQRLMLELARQTLPEMGKGLLSFGLFNGSRPSPIIARRIGVWTTVQSYHSQFYFHKWSRFPTDSVPNEYLGLEQSSQEYCLAKATW